MTIVALDARCLGTGDARRGIGRVARELLVALDGLAPPGVVAVGPRAALTFLRTLPIVDRPARLVAGVLTPGAFARADLVVRLAPTAPSAYDARSVVIGYDVMPLKDMGAHFPWWRRARRPLRAPAYLRSLDVLRRARTVAAISRAVADDLVRSLGVDAARVRVLPLAAGDAFHDAPDHAGPRDDRVLWVLGGTNENKNVPGMMAAMALGGLPPLHVVGGLGERERAFVVRAARRARAPAPAFVGRLSDDGLARAMAAARCVVVPSLDEGFGLPAAEALACGARLACSDIPALREVAGADAAYGDPRDARRLYEAIVAAMARPRPVRAGRRRWRDVGAALLRALDA